MRGVIVRGLLRSLSTVAAAVAFGCSGSGNLASGDVAFAERFLSDRAYRRASLERAVVLASNGYSALRLSKYATEANGVATGWDALDDWNPPVHPFLLAGEEPPARVWDGRPPSSEADFVALGRRAFELWPVEIDDAAGTFASNAVSRERFGMWTDDRGRAAGLVHVVTADGREHAAWTCSGCHARPDASGHLVHGRPAAALDRGAMAPPLPDGSAPASWRWRPGTLDVTADGIDDPTAIPDLRATSHQSHLHCEATLTNALPALAVRVETLLIESAHEQLRPPRAVAVALALYVESLGASGAPGDVEAAPEGATLFESNCAGCHHADGSTGSPIPAATVGTDAIAANAPMRGHGVYRVPSLWAVGDRGLLLHDGSVPDLAALLDAARLATVPGHPFGLDLDPVERARLIDFVATIGR